MRSFIKKAFIFIVAIGFLASGGLFLWGSTLTIPSLSSLEKRKVAESTKIYDRTGEILLYDLHGDIHRTIVPEGEISRHIKNATVAIEDEEFYEHFGISPTDIIRAVIVDITSLDFEQGGSTITQQVIKNALLSQEKKISRKLKEWILAIKLDKAMEKESILTLYLNESPYGGNIYGIEEAAQRFFGKSASEVTIAEAAYLASLPKAPTFYSPYGNNKDALIRRKDRALDKMLELGFITESEYKSAKNEDVEFIPYGDTGIKAPHFVIYVKEYLKRKYREEAIRESGFEVVTTLDYELQEKVEEIVKEKATENEEKFNAENASAVVIDPKTGDVLSMVGSRDYFDENIEGNFNVALAHRQPGSAFKPFIYATALKEGYTPETVVFDLKTQFSTECAPSFLKSEGVCYAPVNYNGKFQGPITLRNALSQSINVPAVKTLYLTGVKDALNTAKAMGIKGLHDEERYGLTLVLGGGEVRLLDITSAYGVFANDGVKQETNIIIEIKNKNGDIIEEKKESPTRVLSQDVARKINDILSDNEARAPMFGYNSPLYFSDLSVAAKTGTTNDYRDAWTIGYSPNVVVGVWAGNNDNSSMNKKVAGYIVSPIWRKIIQIAMDKIPKSEREEFKIIPKKENGNLKPVLRSVWKGGNSYFIDKTSGKLATEFTPDEMTEEMFILDVHSILYWIDKDNPRGEIPENPRKDPQFKRWEYAVNKWKEERDIEEDVDIPTEYDDIHTKENIPMVEIERPVRNNEVFNKNERIYISLDVDSKFRKDSADFYINGRFLGSDDNSPFNFSLLPSTMGLDVGNFTIRAEVYDKYLNKGVAEIDIKITD